MKAGAGRRIGLTALAMVLTGLCVYLGTTFRQPVWNAPQLDGSTMPVVPGIYLLGGLGPAAAYVVETTEGLVLFDTGLERDAQALKTELARQGLDWTRIRAIFLTHVHGDHCGGADRLRAETGARIYAGQAEVPVLVAGEPRDAFFSTFKMPGHVPHSTTVDVALSGNETITIGEIRIRVLETPGHTTGSTCYLLERAGRTVLFSGDVIFRLGEKPLGTYSAYLAPRYRGDARLYRDSLRQLKRLPVPDLVLPGHPGASRRPQSPQLSQSEWTDLLDRGIDEMEQLIARYETEGANFLDGVPKELLPRFYYLGDFHNEAVYGFFSETRLIIVNAPGGKGYVEFIQERLGELGLKTTEPFAVLLTDCGQAETAALRELVERYHVRVVTSPDGVASVKEICPPDTTVVSSDDLAKDGWFSGTTIPLKGYGVAPIGYLMEWGTKRVLVSGRIPVEVDQESREVLLSWMKKSRQNGTDYLSSIHRLAKVQPNLWLPAAPTDARNANLQAGEWNAILEKNFLAIRPLLEGRSP